MTDARETLVRIAAATARKISGDDIWGMTVLQIVQTANEIIEEIDDALLDYEDGWAMDEADRRAKEVEQK